MQSGSIPSHDPVSTGVKRPASIVPQGSIPAAEAVLVDVSGTTREDHLHVEEIVDSGDDAEYGLDILSYLRGRECRVPPHPPPFRRQSPQLDSSRRRLVDWTCQVCERLRVSPATAHLSVRLLDFFMDGHVIDEARLFLVCLVCVMLAAKIEEKDSKVPRISALNCFVQTKFTLREFAQVESVVANYFGWDLTLPTAAIHLDLLFPHAFDPAADLLGGYRISSADESKVRRAFYRFVRHFGDASLQDDQLISMAPSVVASAVLYCARVSLDLCPVWPARLASVSGGHSPASSADMGFVVRRLIAAYNVRVREECTPPRSKRARPGGPSHFTSSFETPPPSARSSSLSSTALRNPPGTPIQSGQSTEAAKKPVTCITLS